MDFAKQSITDLVVDDNYSAKNALKKLRFGTETPSIQQFPKLGDGSMPHLKLPPKLDDHTLTKDENTSSRLLREHLEHPKLSKVESPIQRYREQSSIEKHALFKLRDVVS